MANHPSAEKRNRQRIRRRERNQAQVSRVRTYIKRAEAAIASGEGQTDGLKEAVRLLDKAAQKGVVKRKTASRKISRLTRASSTLSGWSSAIGCARMCDPMMNSSRASPTPSFGRRDSPNASAGLPTFIMIFVRGRRSSARSFRSTWLARRPR